MITKRNATTPSSSRITFNSYNGRRRALLAESDKLNSFLRTVEPTSIEYTRTLARLNEINSQLYR